MPKARVTRSSGAARLEEDDPPPPRRRTRRRRAGGVQYPQINRQYYLYYYSLISPCKAFLPNLQFQIQLTISDNYAKDMFYTQELEPATGLGVPPETS